MSASATQGGHKKTQTDGSKNTTYRSSLRAVKIQHMPINIYSIILAVI